MELGAAEPGLVDVAVAAQVILDRVHLPERAQAGNGRVIVGDRHVEAQAPGVPGDGLAQHVATPVAQRRGDPQHLILVVLARCADDLDDVRLAPGERAGLVERQRAQPADLLEELAAADQDAPPRRRRQAADDRHRRRDHQCTRAGDHQHDQAPPEPLAPQSPASCSPVPARHRRGAAGRA